MSNQQHTPEPWSVRELGDDCFITAAIEPGMAYGPEIMGDDYTGYGDTERKKADARRIVACVNACAGIGTEYLEHFGGTTFNDFKRVKQQRDELLAAIGSQAAKDVIAERHRQQAVEGWTPEHDDQHKAGSLGRAGGFYALNAGAAMWYGTHDTSICDAAPDGWPWEPEWWKPTNARRDLVKAAALILAEIERIDRAAITQQFDEAAEMRRAEWHAEMRADAFGEKGGAA